MYINTFRYKPEDVDCKLCTEYRKKLGCAVKGCPFLAERIEAGVVGYGDAVQNTLSRHMALEPEPQPLFCGGPLQPRPDRPVPQNGPA